MSSPERGTSRERTQHEHRVKHQPSLSEASRALVPIWDSSDPERAPPPLPLNPGSPVNNKSSVSSSIAATAAALTEKARESAGVNGNGSPMPSKKDFSPEKSLFRSQHKRWQSNQNIKEFGQHGDNGSGSSPTKDKDRTPGRSTPNPFKDVFKDHGDSSPEKSPTRSQTPVKDFRDTPTLKRSSRRTQSILGDNTPPASATMLALQNMQTITNADTPLSDLSSNARIPPNADALSSQISSLTTIATALQKEMSALSRRSKDNATDLISLKEATNARDEDIRLSLRELLSNVSDGLLAAREERIRANAGNHQNGEKTRPTSPMAGKSHKQGFSLPRIPSPNSFAATIERELAASPSYYASDGAANIALLEKILREMGTKDGQDQLLQKFSELLEKHKNAAKETASKLDEINTTVKDSTNSRALVLHNGPGATEDAQRARSAEPSQNGHQQGQITYDKHGLKSYNDGSGQITKRQQSGQIQKMSPSPSASDLLGDDVQKLLRRLKDSVSENGGMTAEVKALVRELRGEVLGMGRELGRKLNEADTHRIQSNPADESARKEDVEIIVQTGLSQLKEHLDYFMKEKRRRSSASTFSRNTVDSQEIFDAVKNAMQDIQVQRREIDVHQEQSIGKEDILDAVRESWEMYKPEIELQNFGLERDEILQCLREGLEEHRSVAAEGAGREEVLEAIRDGMEHFQPPAPMETEASITREEILSAFRECLETVDIPGMRSLGSSDMSRNDVIDAVRAGMGGSQTPMGGYGERVLERLQDVIEGMRVEFGAVSDEAKQNVAANGRDTEQVLDALKDGLESLRADIELYVDRAADVTGKDEIIETIRDGLESLRGDPHFTQDPIERDPSDMLNIMKDEFEHMRSILASTLVRGDQGADREEITEIIREGFETVKGETGRSHDRPESILSSTSEILDALSDGLDNLRSDVHKMIEKPVDMTVSYEILDTLKDGFESLKQRMEHGQGGLVERQPSIKEGGELVTAESLKRNDIENLEVLITQLQIKVEALDNLSQEQSPQGEPTAVPSADPSSAESVQRLEQSLDEIKASLSDLSARERQDSDDLCRKEDVDALETLLVNTKAKIDDIVNTSEDVAETKQHVENVENVVRDLRDSLEDISARNETGSMAREDFGVLEGLLNDLRLSVEEIKDKEDTESVAEERVMKTDTDAIEGLCADIKQQIEQMILPDLANLPSKDDFVALETAVGNHRELAGTHHESSIGLVQSCKEEGENISAKVDDLKESIETLKSDAGIQSEEGRQGLDSIGKLLEELSENVGHGSASEESMKEVLETITREFERYHSLAEEHRLENESHKSEVLDKLEESFGDLLTKFDAVQRASEERQKTTEEREADKGDAAQETQRVAEELKLLIDTLGTTVTESVDKMSGDSKTVFGRVDETFVNIEEGRSEARLEHQNTRDDVQKLLEIVSEFRSESSEQNPKVLEAVKDVLVIVGQHFEHSKEAAERQFEREVAPASGPPVQATEESGPPMINSVQHQEAHNELLEKLDQLLEHVNQNQGASAPSDVLADLQGQMNNMASELSGFFASHSKLDIDERENKEKESEEAAILLGKRLVQKEEVEKSVEELQEEKRRLQSDVGDLRAEKERMSVQRVKLSADVASLETALKLRHEELAMMESRAEHLERRILDGVIDHSRALLVNAPSKDRNDMSLKRVRNASNTTTSVTSKAADMALKSRPPPIRMNANSPGNPNRRILSLNQISNNLPAGGGQSFTPMHSERGLGNLKRSHSVKTASGGGSVIGGLRKGSWGGLSRIDSSVGDKENDLFTEEGSDHEYSDTATERRSSLYTGTDRRQSYGTTTDRRSSFGTVTGTLGTESVAETAEEDEEEETQASSDQLQADQQLLLEAGKDHENRVVLYNHMADSGMGTELETPGL